MDMTSISDRIGASHRIGALMRGFALGAASVAALGLSTHAARAETRGYAVSWFYMAAESQKDDCPEGPNDLYGSLYMRGKVNGKPTNVYNNPTSEPDPNIKTVKGHVAYGFNLDGKD